MRKPSIFWSLLFFLISFVCLFSQTQKQLPVFRITAERVTVDFVAVDKQGRFVSDLKQQEIDVYEDDKKQAIDFFLQPSASGQRAADSGDLVRPGEVGAAPGTAKASEEQPATAIVIDSRAIDSNNFVHASNAIRNFIEHNLAAGHAVMIAEVSRGLNTLSPMTRDKNTLLAAVNKLRPQSVFNPLDERNILSEAYFDDLSLQVRYVREALTLLCYALSGRPGRKHVVFFTEGYPMDPLAEATSQRQRLAAGQQSAEVRQALAREEGRFKNPNVLGAVREVVTLANKFGVSFYTIDARGLVAVAGVGQASRSGNVDVGVTSGLLFDEGAVIASFTEMDIRNIDSARNTLIALAAGTNGMAFYNTNNLGVVLQYSTAEQQNYYLAGYVPSAKRKAGEFHRLNVRTSRPGLYIRSRKGYLDLPEETVRNAKLNTAFSRPELFSQLSPLVQIEPARGKTRVVAGVPGAQIRFRPASDKFQGEILFRGMVYDSAGKPVSKDVLISKGFNLALTREQMAQLANQPLLMQDELALQSGQYKLVMVVEDRLSGSLGAAVQEFKVP
ncbi:MAG TPA: VWA domain-containing protein [Acidobacteriota bacterium]|jgi:VWFA-related protein